MMDFEHAKIYQSKEFVDLNETNLDYFHKKLEKTLYSPALKELTVGSLHELLLKSDQMLEGEDKFKEKAKEITDDLYKLGSVIEEMPNCNLLFVDCVKDGEKHIVVMKLNYRRIPMSVVEEGMVRITTRQVLPMQGSPVNEAIVINVDQRRLFLIEKKYLIDGKEDFYLNPQWIKGEEKLTDKQKFSTMQKVIKKLDTVYDVNDGDAVPLMKQTIQEKVNNNEMIKPLEITKKVLEKDYQASEESEVMMNDLGIGEKDEISSVTLSSMEICKLVLDGDIEVKMSVEEYLNGGHLEKRQDESGNYEIVLKNIKEIRVK